MTLCPCHCVGVVGVFSRVQELLRSAFAHGSGKHGQDARATSGKTWAGRPCHERPGLCVAIREIRGRFALIPAGRMPAVRGRSGSRERPCCLRTLDSALIVGVAPDGRATLSVGRRCGGRRGCRRRWRSWCRCRRRRRRWSTARFGNRPASGRRTRGTAGRCPGDVRCEPLPTAESGPHFLEIAVSRYTVSPCRLLPKAEKGSLLNSFQ